MLAWKLQVFAANRKKGPAALTNDKSDNIDQIHADNVTKFSGLAFTERNIKIIFS
jgi:hypothetical protein